MKRKKGMLQKKEMLGLVRNFLSHRLSAAGVSYVVTSRSRNRRVIWTLILLATLAFMSFMTFKVVKEYLGYPKIVTKESKILTRLDFPAVTVCALNPISNHHLEKTSVRKIKKLRQFLEGSSPKAADVQTKQACYSNPMCRWSWFTERCSCASNPCLTEFCMADTERVCACSMLLCHMAATVGSLISGACENGTNNDSTSCSCNLDFQYPQGSERPNNSKNIDAIMKDVQDSELKEILGIFGKSQVDDIMDIEEELMPTMQDIYNFGTEFDRLVISCSFEGKRCDKENFTIIYHPKYGKCYMFNYVGETKRAMDRIQKIHSYGSTSGLNILLQLEESDIVELLTREIGIRVVVHDPHELPFISEHGFNIRQHDVTAAEVTVSDIIRLPHPWGECLKDGSENKFQYRSYPYNQLECQKRCRYYYVYKRCQCIKRSFIRGKVKQETEKGPDFCSAKNVSQSKCITKVMRSIQNETIRCGCFPACRERQYKTSLSASRINEAFYNMIKGVQTLAPSGNGTTHSQISKTEDMVGLKVYYRTLQVEYLNEVPCYSWETLISNIGGNFGFFMGLSLVTFMEVAEFMWDVIINVLPWRRQKKGRPTGIIKRVTHSVFPQGDHQLPFETSVSLQNYNGSSKHATFIGGGIQDLLSSDVNGGQFCFTISDGSRLSERRFRLRSSEGGKRKSSCNKRKGAKPKFTMQSEALFIES